MKTTTTLLLLFIATTLCYSQTNKEVALQKAKEAIKIMDEGKYAESIVLLEESCKLDPENATYPYEIAYAHVLQKDYKEAIKILKKVTKFKKLNSQVYQMLGNCYDYLGESDKAIKTYEEGMEIFPNAGNLHLEKGNVYLYKKDYDKAITCYKNGIKANPNFASNYYRLALLYLNSNNKLNGIIYGEIFMNIERTTDRTTEMSEKLYITYRNAITFKEDGVNIDFCDVIIDASTIQDATANGKEIALPLCAAFGKNFILSTLNEKEVNLTSLSAMRTKFIELFSKNDAETYNNVLFNYQKKMLDAGVLNAYNHYIFMIGAPDEYNAWLETHETEFQDFVKWYTAKQNVLTITTNTMYVN